MSTGYIAEGILASSLAVEGASLLSGSVQAGQSSSMAAGTTVTITALNSGTTYLINMTGVNAITLPAPAAGLLFKFVVGTVGASDTTITSATAGHLFGNIIDGFMSVDPIAANASVTFVASTALVGDSVELHGIDSTHWNVRGITSVSNAITSA